jgi:hypothetical protein
MAVKPEPSAVLCARCLMDGRVQRTFADDKSLMLLCPTHGPVYTFQWLEAVFKAWL